MELPIWTEVFSVLSSPPLNLWHLWCVWAGKHLIARAARLVLLCPQLLSVGSLAHCDAPAVPVHFDNPRILTFSLPYSHGCCLSLFLLHTSPVRDVHYHGPKPFSPNSQAAQGFTALLIFSLLSNTSFLKQHVASGLWPNCFRMM